MRAIQYRAYGGIEQLELSDAPRPEPAKGDVVVRVHRAALNPKDALFRKGRFRILSGSRFPKRCGLDFAGEVAASRSPAFREGDRVFGALDEWRFLRGTLADFVCARDRETAPLDVDWDQGAAVPLVGLTSVQALRDIGRIGDGARVLINGGSGGVGTAAIQVAKILGAHVTTLSSGKNLELCRSLGADVALDYTTDTPEGRFDCIFDAYGNGVKADGPIFISTVPTPMRFLKNVFRGRERLIIVQSKRDDLEQLGRWIADGKLKMPIDSRYPLEKIHDAFRVLESRRTRGKILIDVMP